MLLSDLHVRGLLDDDSRYLVEKADADHPHARPMSSEDLSGLPTALVVTCEYDPIRDEGEAYAKRLEEAGVRVKVSRYEGMIHGFLWMGDVMDCARDLIDEVGKELQAASSG